MDSTRHTLPRGERLRGQKAVDRLLKGGRYGTAGCIRYCFLPSEVGSASRIMVSVPKRSFKRAVKRNLIKRRMRECYRLRKELLPHPFDILFIYTAAEVLPSSTIGEAIEAVLLRLAGQTDNQ